MKVIEALRQEKPTISFEFFPPKTQEGESRLFEVIEEMKSLRPDFASVTCGAMGTARDKTLFWAEQIKEKFQIEPVVHLTCVAESKKNILGHLKEMQSAGINNVLALRGDPPEGEENFRPPHDGFRFAKELIIFIKSHNFDFCIGVAGYPEGHRETASLEKDTQYLKEKIEAGADYIITQLFFDNRFFFDFQKRCSKAGINAPIVPGIMPITGLKQLRKLIEICGASVPEKLLRELERADGDKEAVRRIGIDQAVSQCEELLQAGVPGIHFFVMNKSGPISQILRRLNLE
jgi:methylenetetrahydrofolate reductase (NADPH)